MRVLYTEFIYRYFQAGGNPETVIDLLSDNYKAVAQMTNLIADWLIMAGMSYYTLELVIFRPLKKSCGFILLITFRYGNKRSTSNGREPSERHDIKIV